MSHCIQYTLPRLIIYWLIIYYFLFDKKKKKKKLKLFLPNLKTDLTFSTVLYSYRSVFTSQKIQRIFLMNIVCSKSFLPMAASVKRFYNVKKHLSVVSNARWKKIHTRKELISRNGRISLFFFFFSFFFTGFLFFTLVKTRPAYVGSELVQKREK